MSNAQKTFIKKEKEIQKPILYWELITKFVFVSELRVSELNCEIIIFFQIFIKCSQLSDKGERKRKRYGEEYQVGEEYWNLDYKQA